MWKILWRRGSSIVPEVSRRSVEKMLLLLLLLLCSILLQLLLLFTKDTLPSSSCTSLGHSCAQSNYWEGLCTRPAFGGTWRFGIFTTLFGGQGETERGHIFHSLSRSSLHFFTTWPCSEPCFYYSSAWPPTATQQHRCLGNNTVRVCGNWLHTELLLLFYALR